MTSRPTIHAPRSVVLALWLGHRADPAPSAEVVEHAVSGAQSHRVQVGGTNLGLAEAIRRHLSPCTGAAACLPVPGDPLGAPADAAGAVAAGECVLLETPDRQWALVPEVEAFGSVLEPGSLVRWDAFEVGPWRTRLVGAVGQPDDAGRELAATLRTAVAALERLDVARWREDAAEAIGALAAGAGPADVLPPGLPARDRHVVGQAIRLLAIVSLATADEGGAVNLWQSDQRWAALREVDRSARRALSAVTLAR